MIPRRCSEVRSFGSGSAAIRSSIWLSIRCLMDDRVCSCGATSEVVIVILMVKNVGGGSEDHGVRITYRFEKQGRPWRLRVRSVTTKALIDTGHSSPCFRCWSLRVSFGGSIYLQHQDRTQ